MNNDCNKKRDCGCGGCGCAEPVFSIETMGNDPTILRFNVNGKSVWYDFSPLVESGETCTTLTANRVKRTLDYLGECGENNITARELGSILHLSDIGDVDENSIDDYGILNYRKDSGCPEGCEGQDNGWRADNPVDLGKNELEYILGSDGEGELQSLMPPTDTTKFNFLTWAAQGKAKWTTPTIAATPPLDANEKAWRLYVDPDTYALVIVKGDA